MANILRQRDIIDRRALAEELAQAIADAPGPTLERSVLLLPLKAALARGRAEIRRRFEADGTAVSAVREQCFLVDQLIRGLYDLVTETIYPLANPTAGEKMAIVAVGGYGRGELAPFSDVDLLFLLPYKQTPHTEQVVEYLLYLLWDLGLKVGQATRSVAECLVFFAPTTFRSVITPLPSRPSVSSLWCSTLSNMAISSHDDRGSKTPSASIFCVRPSSGTGNDRRGRCWSARSSTG